MCANYPKGHGELFCKWIETYNLVVMIINAERESGYRQGLDIDGLEDVYIKHPYWI